MSLPENIEAFLNSAESISLIDDRSKFDIDTCLDFLKLHRQLDKGELKAIQKYGAKIRVAITNSPEGGALCAAYLLVELKRIPTELITTYIELCHDYVHFLVVVIGLRKAPEKILFDALKGEDISKAWPLLFERLRTGPAVARRESAMLLTTLHSKELEKAIQIRLLAKPSDKHRAPKSDEKLALLGIMEHLPMADKFELAKQFIDEQSDTIAHTARRVQTSAIWKVIEDIPDLTSLDERSPKCPKGILLSWNDGDEIPGNVQNFIYGRIIDLHKHETDPRLDQIWQGLEINGEAFVKHFAAQPFALAQLGGDLGSQTLADTLQGESISTRRERIIKALTIIENQNGNSAIYVAAFSGQSKQRKTARISLMKAGVSIWKETGWPEKANLMRTEHAARLGISVPPIEGVVYRIEDKLYIAAGSPLMMHGPDTIPFPNLAIPAGPMSKKEVSTIKKAYKTLGIKPTFRAAPASGSLPEDRDALLHAIASMVGSVAFESGKRVFNTLRRRGYMLGPLFEQLRETLGTQSEFYIDLGPRARITLHFDGIMVVWGKWMRPYDDDETRLQAIEVELDGKPSTINDLPTAALWFLLWDLSISRFGKVPTAGREPVPKTPVEKALDYMFRSTLSSGGEDFKFSYDFDDRERKNGPQKTARLKAMSDANVVVSDGIAKFVRRFGTPRLGGHRLQLNGLLNADAGTIAETYLYQSVLRVGEDELWVQQINAGDDSIFLPVGTTFDDVALINAAGLLEEFDGGKSPRTLHQAVYNGMIDNLNRTLARLEDDVFLKALPDGLVFKESVVGKLVATPKQFNISVDNAFGYDWANVPFVFESAPICAFSELNDDVDYTDALMSHGTELALKVRDAIIDSRKCWPGRTYRYYPLETYDRVVDAIPKELHSPLFPYEPVIAIRKINIKKAIKMLRRIRSKLKKRKL